MADWLREGPGSTPSPPPPRSHPLGSVHSAHTSERPSSLAAEARAGGQASERAGGRAGAGKE